jgi:hypothetical protein
MKYAIVVFAVFAWSSAGTNAQQTYQHYHTYPEDSATCSGIHQQTAACHNRCTSTYSDEADKNACVQQCIDNQNAVLAACP